MNRGDLRLVVTILFTALTASVITVMIYARVTSNKTLEARVAALEAHAAEPVVAPVPPVPPVPPTPPAPAEAPDPCDEVSCVLNDYEPACCAVFKKAATPQGLDRAIISEGVAKIKERVLMCTDKSSAKGVVKVTVRVAPSGDVSNVIVKETPDTALGACVAAAMQRATFRRTEVGGSFSFPFVF
jgi:outer membrane biosynthesis protein TonB